MKPPRRLSVEDEDEFLRVANSTGHWVQSADKLRQCAEVLGELHIKSIEAAMRGDASEEGLRHLTGTGQVFQMLAGLAIENVAKGLVVNRSKAVVTKERLTGADLKGHGSNKFLRRADITLSQNEHEFVRRLEKAVDWSGRYPIPTTAEKFAAERQHASSVTDLEVFRTLYDRLRSHFRTAIRTIPRAKRGTPNEGGP